MNIEDFIVPGVIVVMSLFAAALAASAWISRS
jgi:hypothetical protein